MGAIILMLKLGLVLRFGFTESSGDHIRAEPNLDLECLNDYLTEMMCHLTSDQLVSCSEYSLNMSRYDDELFECNFTQLNSGACECSLQVRSRFVLNEIYEVNVLRRKKLLFTENVSTTESIKPKKPVIVFVNKTQSGNFLIVWDTVYTITQEIFSEALIPELIYYVEGSDGSRKSVMLSTGQKEFEIVGGNLESNSVYVVMARVKYLSKFSDYSDPYKFTTSSSPSNIIKIIIPITFICLIFCIITIYYSYTKVITVWWDKMPTPSIDTNFAKQVPNLLSVQTDFSPVYIDSSKLVHPRVNTWPASSPVDIRGENGHNSFAKDASSAEVIYGQTGNESLNENTTENGTQWELPKDSQSGNHLQMPISNNYKNLQSNINDGNDQRVCENSSGFSNKFYMISDTDKFPNTAITHSITGLNESENVFSSLSKTRDPVILTDFEYSPCPNCLGSETTSPTKFTPSNDEIIVVPGYQSVNEARDCGSTDQTFITSHKDVNLLMEKLISNKTPQNFSCETAIIQVENEYKDFQDLLQNSVEKQNLDTKSEFKTLCDLALHNSPDIQIDCSYHRV